MEPDSIQLENLRRSKHRRGIFAVASLVLIALLAFCFVPREPSYKGKSLSYWLQEINRVRSIQEAQEASEAIREMGERVLPFLIKEIGYETPLKRKFYQLAERQSFFKIDRKSSLLYMPSLFSLHQLRSKADPIIPQLLELTRDKVRSDNAITALYLIGPTAIPALEEVCGSTNVFASHLAVVLLTRAKTTRLDDVFWQWGFKGLNGFSYPRDVDEISKMAANLTNRNDAVRRAALSWFKETSKRPRHNSKRVLEAINSVDPKAAAEIGLR